MLYRVSRPFKSHQNLSQPKRVNEIIDLLIVEN